MNPGDTIAAIATPPGKGGIGIVRISGPYSAFVAKKVLGYLPQPRYATFSRFLGPNREELDQGIAIYYPSPNSFTGENVLELQGHGGPVVLDTVLNRVLSLGCRLANPGEFSERAFLNGKIDLVQAEAIIDLIECSTEQAAKLANRTLQGEFSRKLSKLKDLIIALRIGAETAVDFSEEDIEYFSKTKMYLDLLNIENFIEVILESSLRGQILREGMTIVIAGRPNSGKSSLLNALTGYDAAIVTNEPGTTRDLIKEYTQIDGLPLHIIDTAGLRDVEDPVEKEGVNRARGEINKADRILWVFDDDEDPNHDSLDRASLPKKVPVTFVRNKIDLTGTEPGQHSSMEGYEIAISAKNGSGIQELREHLKECVGYQGFKEGAFMARSRHVNALSRTLKHIKNGLKILKQQKTSELLAEELRLSQNCLSEITGEYLAEDLLDEIFSSFCIGK